LPEVPQILQVNVTYSSSSANSAYQIWY